MNKKSIEFADVLDQMEIDDNNILWVLTSEKESDDSYLRGYDLDSLNVVKELKIPNKGDYYIGGFLIK